MAAKLSPVEELKRAISPIAEIIEEARQGRMFILIDEEDRENEGDLIIPAQFATPDKVNFMARFGRGLICLALTPDRTEALGLDPMTPRNQTRMGTAFTVSIEAREGVSTGISAHDRALTIATAIDPTKDRRDIVSPGHVFPLTARDGGTLVRAGHTEASVDISRAAGLNPSAVICEIMNDDGTMARLPELIAFAQFHNLKIGAIDELIAYRRVNERLVEQVAEAPFDTRTGKGFRLVVFRNKLDGVEHAALVKGDINAEKPTLVRVHRIDFAADVMGGYGGRAGLIDRAVAEIEEEGAGVVVLLRDLVPDVISRRLSGEPLEFEADDIRRVVGLGSQILRELGVGRMTVLGAPQKLVGLDGYGLTIDGWREFKS
ncbi:3,4-dihydroxy-2-butanone-4-phosphate synthase [Candidatus Viadribacter manganicus]|uniref:3,4-dihydroxy-2-butanone 4-phosphate synthase n=1 Tax=Candidatus Viadribacter manganicus TaxID=1759059 RepID=A0A1B1ADI3_9PROT|nr:3,4-dihydroxy-2-butanone-4-phosphate synthase [Candidatus Viadribacter manganicus]ANP44620.1 3,4-dihydroxy-2-butanone 4-phosphate synthase [Candidatus Viadribacter manganicus]